MTSTNDGKDVKSNQTSAPKGKTYFIELYKSLEARLSEGGAASERTQHLCEAWQRVHSICLHSAPSTHDHLLSWIQRHTARTVLQTEWQTDKRKDDRTSLNDAIDVFITECEAAKRSREGVSAPWEVDLVERGQWFKRMLERPWDHPVLTLLLNPTGDPPTDDEVLKWLKEERGVTFVSRLYTLVGEKCDDIAMSLLSAVMERARAGLPPVADAEEPKDAPPPDGAAPTFHARLTEEADFTPDVWDTLTDIEFVLLHKRDSKRCIALAKQTPLDGMYYLIERLQKRLETSPREKRLWKNAKEVAILIAQVVIARCMMVPTCVGQSRTALYCCARLLARLLAARLPAVADALANQAPTARHLHTLAHAVDKQLSATEEGMKPYVCELYVRAITAGMNELERLKLKTEKEMEARSMEMTLASWFVQLGEVLSRSDRIMCECALTAFSLHPSQLMYELLDKGPQPTPVAADSDETKEETVKSEFGSWANDSRSQTNFVKTSETLNLKQTQNQANVLSTAIFNEGEALGLSPELCQDIAVLLSGPRVKTLSWDMDRTLLLENCRTYSEQTHGGTKVLTRELKYLNIDPTHYQHLPEDRDEDENDPYYGIERGYEHLVPEEPEDIIWKYAGGVSKTETSSSSIEDDFVAPRRKKKNKKVHLSSDEDSDPLSYMAEAKRVQKKKERPHSKERSKERAKKKQEELVDPLDIGVQNTQNETKTKKPKKERKKKEKSTSKFKGGLRNSLASLLGVKVKKTKTKPAKITTPVVTPVTDSDYDSQGKCSLTSVNSEGNDPGGLHESFSTSNGLKVYEPRKSHSFGGVDSMKKSEYQTGSGKARIPAQNLYQPPNNLTRLPYVPPNGNVRGQSPIGLDRTLTPNITYTNDVRSSLSKLLEIRRQRAAMELKLRQNTPLRKPAIIRQNIEIQANVSPKTVTIPEIPKSYIKNEHAEKLAVLKREVDNILAQSREKKANASESVIQFAKKNDSNASSSNATTQAANTSSAPRNVVQQQNSLKMTDFVNVSYDRLMAEIAERHDRSTYDVVKPPKVQPQHQLGQLQRSYSVLTPGQRDYQNFLKEYERNKFVMPDRALDMSAKKTGKDGKKEILPMSRVEPLIPKAVKKPGPKTMQCAKQSTLVKKPEPSLNTFSRLSYMHKNKQTDTKNKNPINKPPFTTSTYQDVSSELDQIIKEHQQARMRVVQQSKKSNEKGKGLPRPPSAISGQGLPQTSQTTKDHPCLSNLLQKESITSPGASMTRNMCQMKNDKIQQKHISPPKTSLSEKDQNDLLNLLRQQNKLNSSTNRIPGPSCSANMNSNPMLIPNNVVTNKVSSMPDHNSVSTQKKQFARPVSQANNSYQSTIENKLINIISNTLIKQQNHAGNVANNESTKLVTSGTKNVKLTGQEDNVKKAASNIGLIKKKPVNVMETETPEWQTVMSDLLRHKTPSRGPDALDVALNKNSFELAYEKSLQKSSMLSNNFQQQRKTDMPKSATALVGNVIITNKGLKIQNPKPQKTEFNVKAYSSTKKPVTSVNEKIVRPNPSETAKKLPQDVQRKHFTYAGPKHDDPFISGIPNSDYDLLEELMDDDLRKEIGELSSDEESYNAAAQSFLKPTKVNEKRVSVQLNHTTHETATQKTTTDMRCLNARLPSRDNMQSVTQKPVIQCVKNNVPMSQGIGTVKVSQHSQSAATNKIQDNLSALTLTNPSAAVHMPATSNTQNQVYSSVKSFPQNQVAIDPNIYISVPQQQTSMQNVMLIGSELIYDRYATVPTSFNSVSNLAASANVPVNNAPHLALCQTAQLAAPVTSSLIIGGPVTLPINHVSCATIPVQSTVIINLAQSTHPATFVKAPNTKSETPVLDLQENNLIINKANSSNPWPVIENAPHNKPIEGNKAGERKVLSEVQKLIVNEKVEKVQSHEIEIDTKKRTFANEERLIKKRLAIINRKISHQCGYKPIPLSYSPLFVENRTELQQKIVSKAIPLPYAPLNINKDKQKLSDSEEDKLITQIKNNLQDLSDSINDVKSPATPDSIESKENKSLPSMACRRIMLRSSNKITNSNGESIAIESATNKKSKVKLKSNSSDGASKMRDRSSLKKDDKNANLPKRASKRLRSRTLTKEEKILTKNSNRKSTSGVLLAPKIEIKNKLDEKIEKPVLSSINNDMLFDIELELLGTTITKPIGGTELRRKKSIELKEHEETIFPKAIKNQPDKVSNISPADLNVDYKIAKTAAVNDVVPVVSDASILHKTETPEICMDEKVTSVTDNNYETIDNTKAQGMNKQIDDMSKEDTSKITKKHQVEHKPTTRNRSKSKIIEMPPCIVLVEKLTIDKNKLNIADQTPINGVEMAIIHNDNETKITEVPPCNDVIKPSETSEMLSGIDATETLDTVTTNESKNLEFLLCKEVVDTSVINKNESDILGMPSFADAMKNSDETNEEKSKYSEMLACGDGIDTSTIFDKNESKSSEMSSCVDVISSDMTTKDESKGSEMLKCDNVMENSTICNENRSALETLSAEAVQNLNTMNESKGSDTLPCHDVVDNSNSHDQNESEVLKIESRADVGQTSNTTTNNEFKDQEKLSCDDFEWKDELKVSETLNCDHVDNSIISNKNKIASEMVSPAIESPKAAEHESIIKEMPLAVESLSKSEVESNVSEILVSNNIENKSESYSKNFNNIEFSSSITTPNDIIAKNEYMAAKLHPKNDENNITSQSCNNFSEKDNIDLDMTVTCEEFNVFKQTPTSFNNKTSRNVSINTEKSVIKSDEIKENSNLVVVPSVCDKSEKTEQCSKMKFAPALVAPKTSEMNSKVNYDVSNVAKHTVSTPVSDAHSELPMPVPSYSDDPKIADTDDDVVLLDEALNSVSKAPVTEHIEDLMQKKKDSSSLADVNNASDIPQSFKDSIQIEHLPSDDPLKKSVRVSLPNGRKFKATVYGEVHVTFDSLFTCPSIKSTLLNGLNCKKLYTLNIKQITTVAKSDPSKVLSAQIQDIKIPTISEPTETINLLSDDEDECAVQVTQKSPQTFKTEFGKYKILPIDDVLFMKHQDKLNRKSKILLKRLDVVDEVPKNTVSENNILQSIPNQYVAGLMNDIERNFSTKNKSIEPNEVVEIDDSSNDSCEIVDEINSIDLDNTQPEKVINDLKNVLLKELGVEEIKPANKISQAKQNNKEDDGKEFSLNKNLEGSGKRKLSQISSGSSCPFVDLIRKDQLNITRRKCYVKLSRCDSQVKIRERHKQNTKQNILEVSDDEVLLENVPNDEPIVSPEEFSVLNSFDTDIVNPEARSNSPIIELSDVLVSINKKIATSSESAIKHVISLACQANWFTTKHMIHLEGLNNNVLMRPVLVNENINKTSGKPGMVNEIAEQTQINYAVPSLVSLVLKLFQNKQILHQYSLLCNVIDRRRICSLKRKPLPLGNRAASKVPKLNNEIIERKLTKCDPMSTVVVDVSVTDTSSLPIPAIKDIEIKSDNDLKSGEPTKTYEETDDICPIPPYKTDYNDMDCRNQNEDQIHEDVYINRINTPTIDRKDIYDLDVINLTGNDARTSSDTVIGDDGNTAEIDNDFEARSPSPVIEIARVMSSGTVIPCKEDDEIDSVLVARSPSPTIEISDILSSESKAMFGENNKIDIGMASKIRFPSPVIEIAHEMSSEIMITSEESDQTNFDMARETHSPAPAIEIADKISPETVVLSEESENTDIDCASKTRYPSPVLEINREMSSETVSLLKETDQADLDSLREPCLSPLIEITDILSPETMVISGDNKTDMDMANEIRSLSPLIIMDTSEDDDKTDIVESSETHPQSPVIADIVSLEAIVPSEESKQTDNMVSVSEACSFSPIIEIADKIRPEIMTISDESNKAFIDLINESNSLSPAIETFDKMSQKIMVISKESGETDIDSASKAPVIEIADNTSSETISNETEKVDVDHAIKACSPSSLLIKIGNEISSETLISEESNKADIRMINEAHSPSPAIEINHEVSPKITPFEETDKSQINMDYSTSSLIEIAGETFSETVIMPKKVDKSEINVSSEAHSMSPIVEIGQEIILEDTVLSEECEIEIDSSDEVLSPYPISSRTLETSSVTMAAHENEKANVDNSSVSRSSCPVNSVAHDILNTSVVKSTGDKLDIGIRNEYRSSTSTIDAPLQKDSEILTDVNDPSHSISFAKDTNVLFENEVAISNNNSNNETCDGIEMRLAEIVGESLINVQNDEQEKNVQEILKESDNKMVTDKTTEKCFAITDHEYVTSYNMSPKPDHLDEKDEELYEVIYVTTDDVSFLSEDEPISELEEEIIEMNSDEILSDISFDLNKTGKDEDQVSDFGTQDINISAAGENYSSKVKMQETKLEIDQDKALKAKATSNEVSTETIIRKYLIEAKSEVFECVDKNINPETGPCYDIPVIDTSSKTYTTSCKNPKKINDCDDIEEQLAKIVGEPLDVKEQNPKTVLADASVSRKYETSNTVKVDAIVMPESDLKEIQKILESDDNLEVIMPKHTYAKATECNEQSRKSLKRKLDMADVSTSKKKYRKGKNIDCPKMAAMTISDSAYSKEYSSLMNYCSSVKFSFSVPFHKTDVDVHNMQKSWPIKNNYSEIAEDQIKTNLDLFAENEKSEMLLHPLEQSLSDEMNTEYDENSYTPSNIDETNFKMGFGEGSGRVIQEIRDGEQTTLSAATLSDVKQFQPLLPSDELEVIEEPKLNGLSNEQHNQLLKTKLFVDRLNLREKVRSFFKNTKEELIWDSQRVKKKDSFENGVSDFSFSNFTSPQVLVPPSVPSDELEAIEKPKLNALSNEQSDQWLKTKRFVDHLNLRERVRSFFKKSKEELILDSLRIKEKDSFGNDTSDFPFSNFTSPEFLVPPPVEVIVNVVQVGQCPVSAAAQNPVTCDPRVTHVSNASPQCSPENSSGDDLQTTIKTEYTELTTANITLPLMQEYAQHHHSMPMESQETNLYNANDNMSMSTQIKSVVKIELMEETSQETVDENADYEYDGLQQLANGNANNEVQYPFNNVSNNNVTTEPDPSDQGIGNSTPKQKAVASISEDKQQSETSNNSNQIVNAMNAAGISAAQALTKTNSAAPMDTIPQSIRSDVNTSQTNTNSYSKTTPITAMALQQALAQMLPPPLNQTNISENNQHTSTNPPVLHIVQGNNAQSVINKPNGTQLLHIVQNKSSTTTNGTPTSQQSSFSGLSLVDGAIQQNGNQLLHIVNTGNQKNSNAGQLLKRVNLLTNLANVQGANEQKMVQFVCKSADGKSIQLPHQRSMVLRLQPLDPANVPVTTKQNEPQDLTPSSSSAPTVNDNEPNPQEMKSRSLYEENYAKFVQNGDAKANQEKATSLPKFNQVFGKQVYQDKQNDIGNGNLQENSECPPEENNIQLEQMNEINNPPMLIRKPQTQAQPNLVQQIKQSVGHSNIQTMHGGVIYTRQIPVNLGNGQTINLITVPSTEMVEDSTQKQKAEGKFGNQEGDPPVIKIVPTNQPATTTNGTTEDNVQMRSTNEVNPQNNPQTQPQPVLTQMRIKLPMLSKAPQMVGGTRVVRPAIFQIQRNIVGGANQQVYQQLVLTAAPPLGQSIRVPAQTPKAKTPSETQSSPESQMSSSTLEQLREFDMVLEQVKERSTVQPGTSASSSNNSFSKSKSSPDTTDAPTPSTSTKESPTPVLYSVGNTQAINMVNYVNRKSTITSTTTSSYVRSPDSTGVSDSPSSSTTTHLPQTMSSESCASSSCASEAAATTPVQSKPKKKKSKPSTSNSNPFNIKNTPKPSTQKPLEDEQTTQRILYILAEYKEQVENSPDKDKPAPRRRNNPAAPNAGSSKRKKSSSGSRRRDMSPVVGEESCRTMGSEDSSCGTSMGECNECLETHSPEESPKKVVRRLTFEQETHTNVTQTRTIPQRNVIVADGQAFAVRGAPGKPATTVLMPANYLLPVSMVKGGQQIAIVTNRGPKLLVGAGEGGAGGALLFQRLIGPGGLKPVLARPGVRHIRLPTAALHNLQAFNIATTATAAQPPDSTASPAPATTPPDLVDTRAMSSPWPDREAGEVKPERGNSSPEGSEPWNLPSSSIADDYGYEEIVRTDNMDRTVLDAIPDRYSPDMEAQRIFDKMFDSDSKKSMYDSRCGYDIDASDDDKAYHQVVQRRDGRHTRLTHVSSAALRHKYAILEHELRLQKSLSEECEDLGVDSPSASELFPEAELLFAPSPAHEQTIDQCHTPQPTILTQGIPQPDLDDQIATDHLLTHKERHDDLDINLDDVGEIVTVGEDGMTTIPLDHEEFARSHEEFARSHPNTTFHSEPEDGEIPPFTIAQGIKGRPVAFHTRGVPGTVVMAPQTTVISQATVEASGTQNAVKFTDIDNIINSMPSPQHLHNATLPSAPVKERNEGLTKFDRLLNESRELHLSNTASAIVHSTGNGTQVIRRVHYDTRRDARFLVDDRDALITDENKTASENRNNTQSTGDNDASSPERHPELYWESNASARSERRYDFSSDSDKCCKSPYDDANSDSSGVGVHTRLDSVIKAARTERRRSEGSSDESHPPLRTYPAKRQHQAHVPHHEERAGAGKTRAGERCHDESRRRASNRGVVKRGCHCCNGSAAPPKPKKSRPKKSDYPHN